MSHVTRLKPDSKLLLRLIDSSLLNPKPLLPAVRSKNGRSISYACPWCSKRHRHKRAVANRSVINKECHCPVWRELFEETQWVSGVTLYIASEITEAEALRRLAAREESIWRAELEGDLIHRRERGLPLPRWLAPYIPEWPYAPANERRAGR